MNVNNLSNDELKIIFNALYYFSVNAEYHDFDELSHLSDDEIDDLSIKLRQSISTILTRQKVNSHG